MTRARPKAPRRPLVRRHLKPSPRIRRLARTFVAKARMVKGEPLWSKAVFEAFVREVTR